MKDYFPPTKTGYLYKYWTSRPLYLYNQDSCIAETIIFSENEDRLYQKESGRSTSTKQKNHFEFMFVTPVRT